MLNDGLSPWPGLIKKYPGIFPVESFEIACGAGWYDVLDDLCRELQVITDAGGPPVVAVQIKEKFGTMRFYAKQGISEEQARLILEAEARAGRTCERCGKPGQSYSDFSHKILCEEHAAQLAADLEELLKEDDEE